jgi:hypothetical protein
MYLTLFISYLFTIYFEPAGPVLLNPEKKYKNAQKEVA